MIYDSSGLLESFYRADISGGAVDLTSRKGVKKAVIVAGIPEGRLQYEDIASYKALCKVVMELRHENPMRPTMYGETDYSTSQHPSVIELVPLMCRVEIRNLETDFSAWAYRDEKLTKTSAYLINCNGLCPLCSGENYSELINDGGYSYFDHDSLDHPELLYSNTVEGAVMHCYPGRDTRLVIEGYIGERKYFYAFPLGTGLEGDRAERGGNYVYDILLRSKGTDSPTIDAKSEMIELKMIRIPWEEKEVKNEEF